MVRCQTVIADIIGPGTPAQVETGSWALLERCPSACWRPAVVEPARTLQADCRFPYDLDPMSSTTSKCSTTDHTVIAIWAVSVPKR